jgi:UDP-N-acetyl-D-mannosaminuronate dehydrogenase
VDGAAGGILSSGRFAIASTESFITTAKHTEQDVRGAKEMGGATMEQGQILIVGLGEVGLALASVIERRRPVLRHDLERREFSGQIEVMHICIPFQREQQFEDQVVSYMERFRPRLTVINSTVKPGTTRSIIQRTTLPIAYSPVRGKHAHMADDLVRYVKYIAADSSEAAGEASAHYQAIGMRTRVVNNLEALEVAKLAETTNFGVLIAFAQELNRYAGKVGGDYEQILAFFSEIDFLPSTRYFPGFIGGHCVIPNIHLLLKTQNSPLLKAVLDSNAMRAQELQIESKDSDLSSASPQHAEGA